jgi:hypothetical protein
MLKTVLCQKCKKVLCKIDEDGLIHVKWSNRSPQYVIQGSMTVVCPPVTFHPNGMGVPCGAVTRVDGNSRIESAP